MYCWDNPVILDGNVNSASIEVSPEITDDGRILFFIAYTSEYSFKLYYSHRIIQPAKIAGNVTDANDNSPAYGVVVALYLIDETGHVLIADDETDPDGNYSFEELMEGDYVVEIVSSIGFDPSPACHEIALSGEDVTDANFVLYPLVISNNSRSPGYWKHQVNVILEDRGYLREDEEDITIGFPGLIFEHFYDHPVNEIRIEGVTCSMIGDIPSPLTLEEMHATLSTGKGVTSFTKAKRQYLTLLLNVVSNKIDQQMVITEDDVKVCQVITFINELVEGGVEEGLETAKLIAETINHGRMVDPGVIPTSTSMIIYNPASPRISSLSNYPNPFNPVTRISFSLNTGTDHSLAIYDVRGALVKVVSSGYLPAGDHVVHWDGTNRHGCPVKSGVYFYMLRAASEVEGNKMVLLR